MLAKFGKRLTNREASLVYVIRGTIFFSRRELPNVFTTSREKTAENVGQPVRRESFFFSNNFVGSASVNVLVIDNNAVDNVA